MFRRLPSLKSLPQTLGLPFLSTQEDAQLRFKSGEGGIKRLAGSEVIPLDDVEYWSQYYTLFGSAGDVYSLISAQDVRSALQTTPLNLAHLLIVLSSHLFSLLPSASFPSPPASTSLPSQLANLGGASAGNYTSGQDLTREALNCLRVMGRVLVIVYEEEGGRRERMARGEEMDEEGFAERWLWKRERVPVGVSRDEGQTEESQFKIEDEDEDEDGSEPEVKGARVEDADIADPEDEGARAFSTAQGHPPSSTATPVNATATNGETKINDPLSATDATGGPPPAGDEAAATGPCLGDRLFSCAIDLLFCAGFTLSDGVKGGQGGGEKINYVIWEKGIGSTVSVGSSAELDRNKTEVLRFLIILLSTTIYTPPHLLSSAANLPLSHLTHSLERRLVLSLLCSFLNTALAPRPSSALGAQIPYQHLISKSAEERRTLVRGCLMVLLVALDHRLPSEQDDGPDGAGQDENAFRYFLSKLHRKEDFAFILSGILSTLEEHTAVQNGYLPGSQKPVPYILETFMLLWRIVDCNKRFRAYLFDSGRATDLIGYLLIASLELKDDPAHHGLLRLMSYLLQNLSADQGFANALNQSLRLSVPTKWAVQGSLADFMIVSIYSIATTPGLNPLFPALTISIANSAPYLQNLGVQASTRLLQLFKAFSAPNFLLADEGHPRLVYYLLETFNSILYHQLNTNPNLVYAILRSHQDFQTLATFTLVSGLRDIQRRKALRAAVEAKKEDSRPGISRTPSELDMLAEKAALLGRQADELDEPMSLADMAASHPSNDSEIARPLASPGDHQLASDPLSQTRPPPPLSAGMSEKARGKMRARAESTASAPQSPPIGGGEAAADVPDEELMRVAEAGVGPNGYVPTEEWVASWQKGLPLDPVLVAISELLPRIQDSQRASGAPSSKVLNLLKESSLSEVLPPAPPISPRRFQWSAASQVWLTSLLWGDIYVAGLTSIGIWRDTTVRLFGVKQAPARGRGAQVAGVLKRLGVV